MEPQAKTLERLDFWGMVPLMPLGNIETDVILATSYVLFEEFNKHSSTPMQRYTTTGHVISEILVEVVFQFMYPCKDRSLERPDTNGRALHLSLRCSQPSAETIQEGSRIT